MARKLGGWLTIQPNKFWFHIEVFKVVYTCKKYRSNKINASTKLFHKGKSTLKLKVFVGEMKML